MHYTTTQIIGHRGIASLAPENTLGGFHKAAQMGVTAVELDVSLLGDGTPVVIHDASIDRCSDSVGLLSHMTQADLGKANHAALFPDWPSEPIPTLQQVIAVLNQYEMSLNLEIKDHQTDLQSLVRTILAEIRNFHNPEQLILSSFNQAVLAYCLRDAPTLRRGVLFEALPVDWLYQAQQLQAFSVHADWQYLSYKDVQAVKQAGYPLYCWTANQPEAVASLWDWGMDAVISDCPQDFLALVN